MTDGLDNQIDFIKRNLKFAKFKNIEAQRFVWGAQDS